MNLSVALLVGGLIGAIEGGSIFFAPEEPYKLEITFAATLKGMLVSLLMSFFIHPTNYWWQGLGFGALFGLALALIVFLAKGGFRKAKDTPYLLPAGIVSGAIIGLLDVLFFAFSSRT